MFEVLAVFSATFEVAAHDRSFGPNALHFVVAAGMLRRLPGFTLTTALHESLNRHLVAARSSPGMTNLAARYLRIPPLRAVCRIPPAVMLIPGILVLIPRSLSYASILARFQTDLSIAVNLERMRSSPRF
jgi:uncharacterized membrane protein YjjP (DUF1212 family)